MHYDYLEKEKDIQRGYSGAMIWKPAIWKTETGFSAAKSPLRQMKTNLPERGTADVFFA